MIADIRARRQGSASLRAVAAATGLSTGSVRCALTPDAGDLELHLASDARDDHVQDLVRVTDLPMLAVPAARTGDRVAARWSGIECVAPVFTPTACVRLAGLLLAMPALEATGLLTCANDVYRLPGGFYGLNTVLIEGVLRALAGEPRAQGAPGSTRPNWAGSRAWTGHRRSRPSAAESTNSPRWAARASCRPRSPAITRPATWPTSPG